MLEIIEHLALHVVLHFPVRTLGNQESLTVLPLLLFYILPMNYRMFMHLTLVLYMAVFRIMTVFQIMMVFRITFLGYVQEKKSVLIR